MGRWVEVSEAKLADVLFRFCRKKYTRLFPDTWYYLDGFRRALAKVEYDRSGFPTGFFVREEFLVPEKPQVKKLGFSGTRLGLTPEQQRTIVQLVADYRPEELVHGDAIGADAQFGTLPGNFKRIVFPSNIPSQRAFSIADEVRTPRPPLTRNRHIIDYCDGIIAAPAEAEEQKRGGTWSSIRFARSRGKLLAIILPDGTVVKG